MFSLDQVIKLYLHTLCRTILLCLHLALICEIFNSCIIRKIDSAMPMSSRIKYFILKRTVQQDFYLPFFHEWALPKSLTCYSRVDRIWLRI